MHCSSDCMTAVIVRRGTHPLRMHVACLSAIETNVFLSPFALSPRKIMWTAEMLNKYPRIAEWAREAERSAAHSMRWLFDGLQILGENVGESISLAGQAAGGRTLSRKEREIISQTTRDCLKLIPLSIISMAPFGSLLLTLVIHKYSQLLPSTFFQPQCNNVLHWQQVKRSQKLLEELSPQMKGFPTDAADHDKQEGSSTRLWKRIFPKKARSLGWQPSAIGSILKVRKLLWDDRRADDVELIWKVLLCFPSPGPLTQRGRPQ